MAIERGTKNDDPAKVIAAKRMWDELREDVAALAGLRIDAAERAMVRDRSWTLSEFSRHWARHPLMMHLAQRIVWCARCDTTDANGAVDQRCFRVAEDGSFADVHDEGFEPGASARLTIPHPFSWPDDSLEAWRRVFTDYELLQPFAQLTRPRPALAEADVDKSQLELPAPPLSMGHMLLRLRRLGWVPFYGAREFEHDLPLGGRARLSLGGNTITLGFVGPVGHSRSIPLAEAGRQAVSKLLDELGPPTRASD